MLFGFVFFYIDMMTVPVFLLLTLKLRKKYPYPEVFWPVFSRIGTEYGEILLISSYSVQILENTDQKNSEYAHFLRCVKILCVAMKRSNSIYCWATKRFFHIFHQWFFLWQGGGSLGSFYSPSSGYGPVKDEELSN